MNKEKGFLQLLLVLILLVIIISLLGISIGDIPQKNTVIKNFSYLFGWTKILWTNYIYPYAGVAWDKIEGFIWEPLLKAAEKIKK